ncbi:hypothetical protein HJG60_009140 [Phyllostomus discolor]|uniref:Uncharacterized protein n=1 Tax=Phyllostomus discolor TaxID=89673 RepID=A0A833YJS4_9CHIR|nr:hypothetical protein HJG60_009140 [Phyllostomus discolor]
MTVPGSQEASSQDWFLTHSLTVEPGPVLKCYEPETAFAMACALPRIEHLTDLKCNPFRADRATRPGHKRAGKDGRSNLARGGKWCLSQFFKFLPTCFRLMTRKNRASFILFSHSSVQWLQFHGT